MTNCRRKVGDGNDEITIISPTNKGNHAVLGIIAINPLKAAPVKVNLPEFLVVYIELIQSLGIGQHLGVHLILFREMPIKAVIPLPLNKLTKFTALEQQLLAWMSHPITKEATEARKFLPIITWHFVNQGALAMNYLIMGKRQHKILTKGIHHGEGNLVMMPLAVDWIQTTISQDIIHPAHIPLVVKAHATHINRLGNIWPGGGLLSNHQSLWILSKHGFIQLVEEIYSLQIAVAAMLIRLPLAILSAIIQIQHIGHSINAEAINMILIHPENSIGNQKALYLGTAIIKIGGTPASIICSLRIVGFIQIPAIKISQTMIILTEMTWYPVHNNTDTCLMCLVNQITQIIRSTKTAGSGIVASSLIAPRAVERMLTQRHKLYVGIIHILHIVNKLVSQFPIGQGLALSIPPPGAKVNLIGQHRLAIGLSPLLFLLPLLILPLIMIHIKDTGSGSWWHLAIIPIWISFHNMRAAMLWHNSIFVNISLLDAWDKDLPDLSILNAGHFIYPGIPIVKLTNYADRFGIRSPYAEANALLAILLGDMCSQHLISLAVSSLME